MSISSTPSSSSTTWRFKQVYVEIPPSPLHSHHRASLPILPSRLSFNHKENTPLKASITKQADAQPIKRKSEPSDAQPPSKKPKVGEDANMAQASELINCHQCKVKRPPSDILQCTFTICRNPTKPHRCSTKYCRNCLRKHYNEALDTITTTTQGHKEPGHADAAYIFKCPKCRGQCNCWKCRHKHASNTEPTSAKGVILKETQKQPKPKVNDKPTGTGSAQKHVERVPKPIVIPDISWVKIPTLLSLKDAEDRIFIREFFLRFSGMRGMSITKAQLEELECIGGMPPENESEKEGYSRWVTEICVRSLVLSLIGALAAEEDSSATLSMKNAMKDIRSSGVNMSKIWVILSSLRTALGRPEKPLEAELLEVDSDAESSEDRIILEFPDPSPPPANTNARSTRTRSTTADALTVVHTAQMIPVILGLIETVLESHAVRVELEEGTKAGREKFRESRDCLKLENESWDALKKSLEEAQVPDPSKIKIARLTHKSRAQAVESAAKVIASSYLPRFTQLGSDPGGRTYWALTPGVYDREYASEYITSRLPQAPKSKKARNRKFRQQKDQASRKALQEWSWFLAVWGNHPSNEATGDKAQWWGFWDPVEIHKLADWVSVVNGLKTNGSVEATAASRSSEGLKNLVKGITEYATVLEWRIQGEDD
ncbi:hypothetical protein BDP27DRAFT_1324227 [Rhodocollybia butyracea]|uniref:Zinc-finger domain-containing protein n=1 Tax=Rhodocollybia butyracea TaxID=206335 RepID=A0A9P5U7M0_9AGAR|nr:hypothetical protein BDP27DRAFT_1324227 [Rhodocollybia butyracea]